MLELSELEEVHIEARVLLTSRQDSFVCGLLERCNKWNTLINVMTIITKLVWKLSNKLKLKRGECFAERSGMCARLHVTRLLINKAQLSFRIC